MFLILVDPVGALEFLVVIVFVLDGAVYALDVDYSWDSLWVDDCDVYVFVVVMDVVRF